MASFTQVMKSGVGPKLVPFFKTAAIYFVVFIPVDQPSVFAAVLKILPIVSLVFFVLLHGMSLGEEYSYSRRILIGLLFSLVGDVLLVWDHLFLHGLSMFLIAQIFYISAFGFKPLKLYVAAVVYGIMIAGLMLLLPQISTPLNIGVSVYSILLMTMVWRAVSRVQIFQELWTWTKLFSCVGGVLFAFSDTCIGFHHFYAAIPYSQVIIMTSYYAAQLGIALSVIDSKACYLDSLQSSSSSADEDLRPLTPLGQEALLQFSAGVNDASSSSSAHQASDEAGDHSSCLSTQDSSELELHDKHSTLDAYKQETLQGLGVQKRAISFQ